MAYNGWKMMDKIDVAVRTSPVDPRWADRFDGYVVEHGDKKALESAKDWAYDREYDYKKKEYTKEYKPVVHTFDNTEPSFTVKILKSAGGSSQGGRLSFLACQVERDGIKFVIGVNDELLVDLIRNSHIDMGVIQEKVMFVRKAGKPGFIHEGMDAYKEAVADMKQKSDLKKAKKTKNWEIGGVYSTLTQTDVCLGEVWDTMEEYEVEENYNGYRWGSRKVTKYKKTDKPVKMTAWVNLSTYTHKDGVPADFETFLKEELKERTYIYFSTGTPPARTKASQLEVKDSDMALLDKMLKLKHEYGSYYNEEDKIKGRYVRKLK